METESNSIFGKIDTFLSEAGIKGVGIAGIAISIALSVLSLIIVGEIAFVTAAFTFIIPFCFFWMRGIAQSGQERASSIGRMAPGFLVTIGVFGTFLGIFIGLLNFDVGDIRGSVPELLGGLKIAFLTSVFGMFFGILWRGIQAFQEKIDEDISEDSPVVRVLSRHLEDFIKKFNMELGEKFGENFAKLNDAMGKILEWQENNRQHVGELIAALDKMVENLQGIDSTMAGIAESMEKIPPVIERIEGAVEGLDEKTQALKILLEGFKNLGAEAEKTFPIIKKNIDNLTKTFEDLIKASAGRISGILEASTKQINADMQRHIKEFDTTMANEIRRVITALGRNLATVTDDIANRYKGITDAAIPPKRGSD